MFDNLVTVGRGLHAELVNMYWVLLPPLVLILIIIELLQDKDSGPNVPRIIKRAVMSMLLLWSFNYVLDGISMIGDGITTKIGGTEKLGEVLKNLGPNYDHASNEWFNLRETFIYLFNVAAYIVAYLGFFVSVALIHFVWTVLFIVSPLMILMYVPESTASITKNLYKGLISVMVWKIMFSILGALLLDIAMNPSVTGMDDFLVTIVVNLFIGLSMLFIPITTKSLINDGLQASASMLASAPALAAAGAIKAKMVGLGKSGIEKTAGGLSFLSKPVTNPVTGRLDVLKKRIAPRIAKMKRTFESMNLSDEAKRIRFNRQRNQYGPRK